MIPRHLRRQRRRASNKYLALAKATFATALSLTAAGSAFAQCVSTGPVTTTAGCADWGSGDFTITSTGIVDGTGNPLPYALLAGPGTVGTLINQGTIIGGASFGLGIGGGASVTGILNEGTITSPTALRNIGTISNLTNAIDGHIVGLSDYGVDNDGRFVPVHIGTLVNNGTITASSPASAASAAVANVGALASLDTLTNTGSLVGSSTLGAGISNAAGSTIGTVNNAMTGNILGVTTGILNSGTISTIANQGLIAGTSLAGDETYGIRATGGSIGLIQNDGTIQGAFAGVVVEGANVQAIDNSGTISSATSFLSGNTTSPYVGLLARTGASIGPVTNSGTITGLYNAIQVDATSTIGTITNSGQIAGDITSASTTDLVIAGGSGNTVGRLTGSSGGVGVADKGLIKLTGANVVFASGNLLLNDDIGVGATHAVINSGATLQISNPITVIGNYTQTGGGLAINAANATTYGYLDISGDALVGNTTISLNGSDLAAGQSYSVVRAGGSAAYSGNTAFVSTNNGLLAQTSTTGGALVVTLFPDAQHHYWDGTNTGGDGAIAGGAGTWTATGTNWTSTDGASNGTLDTTDVRPVFGGAAGTVTVDASQGAINVSGMQFSTDGYRLTGAPIGLTAAASAIEVDNNVNATIDSVLQGSGGLAKTGSGMLILNGVNTYTGGTTVDAGTLEIGDADHAGASIQGNVAVGAAGTLRGHGTIDGNVMNNGIVRPGGSIGTLTIAGDYTQSSSGTLFVDVSPTAASQLKVSGTATLGGALNVLYGPGTYSAASYRIIDAANVSGKFASVTSNAPANLAQSVQNLADGSTLTLAAPSGENGAGNGGTGDNGAGNGGTGDNGAGNGGNGGSAGTVVIAPTNATIFGATSSAAIREGQRVNDMLLSRLGASCADAASAADCARPGRQAWAQIASNTAHARGNDDAPSYKDSHYGFLAGLDKQVGAWAVGVAGGYSHVDVSEDEASGKIDTVRIAGYGSRRLGPVDMAATLGAAYDFLQSQRSFAGLGSAKGDTDGQEITAGLQASLPLATGPVTVTPRLGMRYQYFHAASFGETGPTSQNLDVDSQDLNSLQPYAQVAVGLPFRTGAARPALVEARVGYSYETLDAGRSVAAAAGDGTRFTLPGVSPSRGMLTAGMGLTLPLGKAVDITVSYDRLLDTGNVFAQAFQLQGTYRF
jgi:autotransporter-associated beta strand protein